MALIVEDGSIVVGAESYATVAQADAYLAASGYTSWDALDPQDAKEPALRLATRYMTQTYRKRWYGYRVSNTQSLDWPRYNVPMKDTPSAYFGYPSVYQPNVVPAEVVNACIELAYRQSTGVVLLPDTADLVKSNKVGPIEVVYETGSRGLTFFTAVDAILTLLLRNSAYVGTLSRA